MLFTGTFAYNKQNVLMKVLDIKVMRGPNYWSNYRKKLIVMKLDIGCLEKFPTNEIDGFYERITKLIPSLHEHECSEGCAGGFFQRVKKGTWMGHVIEHIALEIQTLAGMYCGYGRTRAARGEAEGVYNVVFSYTLEKAGLYAAKAAIEIAEALICGADYDLEKDIKELKRIKNRDDFGPSTGSIVEEAVKRGIPVTRLNEGSHIMFGYGVNQKQIRATMTCATSHMAVENACDKAETKRILQKAHIPMPSGETVFTEEGLREVISEKGFPLVIKPLDGNHGRGVTTNIHTIEQAVTAFNLAKTISDEVIIERFVTGHDYRFLLINYKLIAVAKRTPAMITGDGISTIQQLIDVTNLDPNRGDGHEKVMTTIKIDSITEKILAEKNLAFDAVLPQGTELYLKDTANISTGGTSTDVTNFVHPHNVFMAERIAKLMKLDVCGIDVVAEDVNVPITNENGGIIEVNACPGFRMHLSPSKGLPRNVAEPVMNMLFPEGKESRIPIIAITGTNGKTTSSRLMAHMAKTAGHKVGFTTTDGIYIHDHLIYAGDCTGSTSTETVLTDPTVDFAVLECARGGILRSGLGFDTCDISIITNVSEDHLGLKGINTLGQMADVKAVVARSTKQDGYAVLNADDDLVYDMRHDVDSNVALFSMDANNPRIIKHCAKGGLAAFMEEGNLILMEGGKKTVVEKINEVPLSFDGKATSMIKNILGVTLAAYAQKFSLETIRAALRTFIPSPETTPGRMNIYNFKDFDVMIDYAHNSGGLEELRIFMQKITSPSKIGIITGVGDRRDEDIRKIGVFAAEAFTHIIIRHDKDMRGRSEEEITSLITEGIRSVDQKVPISVISDELDALRYAMESCEKGSFIVSCTDSIKCSTAFVKEQKEKEEKASKEMLAREFVLSQAS